MENSSFVRLEGEKKGIFFSEYFICLLLPGREKIMLERWTEDEEKLGLG